MRLVKYRDERGELVKLNLTDSKITPAEIFWINRVPVETIRGGHAHFECIQEIFLIRGSVRIYTENKVEKSLHLLQKAGESLLIPPMTWSEQMFLQEETEIAVISSLNYSESDYIRDYSEFFRLTRQT